MSERQTTMQRHRAWQGPAVFSYGFRTFFLLAGVQALWSLPLFVLWYLGLAAAPEGLSVLAWHSHALLFGYVPAVIAGFLLTAVPNWTGRLPVIGWPLVGLAALWLAGRIAAAFPQLLGPLATAVLDLSFLVVLALVIGREIVAGKNLRNLKVLALVAMLVLAGVVFHVDLARGARPLIGERLALSVILMLIMLIGGRIIPSFTGNWLRQRRVDRLPAPFGRLDAAAMVLAGLALLAWVLAQPLLGGAPVAVLLLAAGVAQALRLARWQGAATLDEPLVSVLHAAYAFVPLGFGLAGLGAWLGDAAMTTAAIHAWTSGAIGLTTLAVMTRASLGHSGQPLHADRRIAAIYLLAGAAALLRVASALLPQVAMIGIGLAGLMWTAAYAQFLIVYAPMLMRPRR